MARRSCDCISAVYVIGILSLWPVTAASTQEAIDDTRTAVPGARVSLAFRADGHRGLGAEPLLPYGSPDPAGTPRPLPFLDDRAKLRLPGGCAGDVLAPGVTVQVEDLPAPKYNHTLTKTGIRSLDSERSGQAREAVGLTLVNAGYIYPRTVPAEDVSGTRSCAVVSELTIRPVMEVVVYVPIEYTSGSCNYYAVKRHEDKHVAIARRLAAEFKPKFEEAVRRVRLPFAAAGAGPETEKSLLDRAMSAVLEAVQGVIDDLGVAMTNENRRLDAADTQRAVMECPFW